MKKTKSWGGKRPGAGRKATGKDPVTAVRLAPTLRAEINNWRQKQPGRPTLSEAIRRLVGQALASDWPQQRTSEKAAAKAAAMAGSEIDKLVDKSASAEEQAQRKRRLTRGPREFRDIRKDHSKQ